jgi:hypothetical protein
MDDDVIEKLVARLPRPSPSPELDTRIAQITRQAAPARTSLHVRRVFLLVGSTACAGFLGFVLGRQTGTAVIKNEVPAPPAAAVASLRPPPKSKDLTTTGPKTTDPKTTDPVTADRVHIVRAEGDALVKFLMPPKRFVGLFGNRQLETRDSASQLR